MKKVLKPWRIIVEVIPYLIFLVAFILILNVVMALKNQETPTFFGFGAAVVVSPSMEDTILTGDLIVYKEVDPDTLVEGDIITFWQPSMERPVTITHRIVEIEEGEYGRLFTTKGDHNNASLDWEIGFSESMIIGKYVAKSTFMGQIYVWFVSAGIGVVYVFVIIIFLIIALMEVKNIIKELSKARKKALEEDKEKMVQIELQRLREEQQSEKKKE